MREGGARGTAFPSMQSSAKEVKWNSTEQPCARAVPSSTSLARRSMVEYTSLENARSVPPIVTACGARA